MTIQAKDSSETMNKQVIVISSMKVSYDELIYKMSINRQIKFDTSRKENEEVLKNNFDKFKAKESSSINMKAPDLNS